MTYVDGFVVPVKAGETRDSYIAFAEKMASIFKDYGVTRIVECWGDDVPDGKVTDFRRAVQAGDGETVVFSWLEWPSKEVRDAGMTKMMDDPRMQPSDEPMPIDGRRMIFGGFAMILDT